jgi:hypothetical protein
LRSILVALVALLLVGPILKLTINRFEKPAVVVLVDNSSSVGEVVDSVQWNSIRDRIEDVRESLTDQGYEVQLRTLDNEQPETISFNESASDLNGAIRQLTADFEGRKLDGVILVTDGIYNSGSSPLYTPLRMPVYTVGLGDTTRRVDLVLRNLVFNKIAYQGNKFPLRAEVIVQGIENQNVVVSLFQKGKLVARENKNSSNHSIIDFDFQLDATEQGLQRLDVSVEPLNLERNKKNNNASAFVEVVEGKKKILVVAPSPHPDIRTLRAVVEKNANYEFILHIPSVVEGEAKALNPSEVDLVIFHQVLDVDGRTLAVYNRFLNSSTSAIYIIGSKSNLRQLKQAGIPITFENPGQWDEVTPVINNSFRNFGFSDNTSSIFSRFPPVSVPFGRFTYPVQGNQLLFQRIGSVATDRPLLFTLDSDSRKQVVMIGEGIWRWRLDEYAETQNTEAFDDVFSNLIQYASTVEDRRKFKSFPLQNEFTDAEPVVFESQVYNELFEQVYGNRIDIEIKSESTGTRNFNYTTGPGNTRYRIGGLTEGVYRYSASTELNGVRERVSGEFLVKAQNLEVQNLTADFNLLRKWADNTGGKFYQADNMGQLTDDFGKREATSLIHSEESFNSLINLKWVFALLLLLISAEWFTRKYSGSY